MFSDSSQTWYDHDNWVDELSKYLDIFVSSCKFFRIVELDVPFPQLHRASTCMITRIQLFRWQYDWLSCKFVHLKKISFKFLFVEKADNVTSEKIVLPCFFSKFSSLSSSLKSTIITRQRNVISCFVIDLLEQGDFFQTFAFNQIIKLSCRHSEMTFISSFIFLQFLQQSPRCTELTSSGNLLSYTNRSFLSLVLFSKTFNKPFHYFSHYCKYSFPLNFKYCPQRL